MKVSKVARLWKALRLVVPVLLVALSMVQMVSANAQDDSKFGVRPTNQNTANTSKGYFTLSAMPGASIQESITLSNPSTVPVKLMIVPVDAATSQRSGPAYLDVQDPRKEVGTWIKFDMNQVTLDPQKQLDVKFTVAVPGGVAKGQHLGGIVVQPVPEAPSPNITTSAGSSFGVTTVSRNVIAVMVTVGTEKFTPSLKIEGVQIKNVDGSPTLTMSLTNDGPVLTQSKGEITVTDSSGNTVFNNKLSLESLVPQTRIDYPIFSTLTKTPGTYTVKATLDFGGTAPAVYSGALTVAKSAAVTTAAPVKEQPSGLIPGVGSASSQPTASSQPAQVVAASKTEGDSQNMMLIIGGGLVLLVVVGGGSYFLGKKGKNH